MADYKDIIAGTISSIVGKVKEAAESPSVQQAVGKVKEAAGDTVNKVKEAAEGSTVKEVYEQGASRVKSYSRIAKLSLQVNGEYEELRRVYAEIGKLCYEQHRDAPEEFFAPLFSQVEAINLNGYRDAEGNEYSYEDDSPYTDLIEEYRTLQYNYLFDADGRIDQIFTLGDQAEE